jgi:Tfp pilus assembly protein PilW
MKRKIIKNKNRKTGFSLIELLLYIAILGMFIFAITSFLNIMTSSRINNQTVLEVNNQGSQIIRIITQTIRNATGVNNPSFSSSSNVLNLSTSISGTSPTIFSESGGILSMKEGSSSAVSLNNDKVVISNLLFENLSQTSNFSTVRISFTLTSTQDGPGITSKVANFYGSATVRK